MLGAHLIPCLDRRRGGWSLPVELRHRGLRAAIVAALATVCLLSLATPRALAAFGDRIGAGGAPPFRNETGDVTTERGD